MQERNQIRVQFGLTVFTSPAMSLPSHMANDRHAPLTPNSISCLSFLSLLTSNTIMRPLVVSSPVPDISSRLVPTTNISLNVEKSSSSPSNAPVEMMHSINSPSLSS